MPSGNYEYTGVTFSKGKTIAVHCRKTKGLERLKNVRLWFRPWVWVEKEILSDNTPDQAQR